MFTFNKPTEPSKKQAPVIQLTPEQEVMRLFQTIWSKDMAERKALEAELEQLRHNLRWG